MKKALLLGLLTMIAASVSFAQTTAPKAAKKVSQGTAPAPAVTNTPDATMAPTPQASPAATMAATPAASMTVSATPATPASTPKASTAASTSEGQVYLGLAGGIDAPVQNFNPLYTLGFGGKLLGGYSFDKNVAVQLDVDGLYYSATGSNVVDIRVVPEIKYTASGMNDIQPFVFAGPGIDLEFGSDGSSVTNFDALVGAGIQFDLGNRTNLFIEGEYNFIFATGLTAQDIPVLAGVNAGL